MILTVKNGVFPLQTLNYVAQQGGNDWTKDLYGGNRAKIVTESQPPIAPLLATWGTLKRVPTGSTEDPICMWI